MTAPAVPRQRPQLAELAPDGMTAYERELFIARLVADGEVDFGAGPLKDLVVNLLATVEEQQRVNVGLIGEISALKKKLQPGENGEQSLVPGLEAAYELIAAAIGKIPA